MVEAKKEKNAAAAELGKLGGRARNKNLTSERIREISSNAGKAGSKVRNARLTPERRSEIARIANAARWEKQKKSEE